MKIPNKLEKWILVNRNNLRELFELRLEDIKDEIIDCSEEDRPVMVLMAKEFRSWMNFLTIVENKEKTDIRKTMKGV